MLRSTVLKSLKEFKDLHAKKYGILVLGVFGSTARNEATPTSDVDIVLQTLTPDPYVLVHIKEDLEKMFNKQVDIVRLRERMNPFLKNQIEKDAHYV